MPTNEGGNDLLMLHCYQWYVEQIRGLLRGYRFRHVGPPAQSRRTPLRIPPPLRAEAVAEHTLE